MLIIGSHVSFNKNEQLLGSVNEALSYNANALMLYTGAPQNTTRNPINLELKEKAYELIKKNNLQIIVHAPYIINMANDKNFDFNVQFLKDEIKRVEELGLETLVIHPGSHVNLGIEKGIKNIINTLNQSITSEQKVIVCLETMAGKGSELGTDFEQLSQIINNIELKDKIGLCLDTCHLNDAGYDISDFDKILDEIALKIGLDKVKCVHINDSKNIIGAHKDRHENIGLGTIGFENLINIIYNERLKDVPKILETPYVINPCTNKKEYPPYKFEIEMIKNKKMNKNLLNDIITYYK